MIQAIFFDFNGVIIDDERIQMAVYRELPAEQGIELTEADYYGALGMDDKTFVRAAYERSKQTIGDELMETLLRSKVERHRKLIEDELPLCPGAVTFLRAAAREFSLGLVSMANRQEIHYVLERANLHSLFSIIVNSDDVSRCKPAPDCYESGLQKLNAKRRTERQLPLLPHECLVVEDSPPGIEAGKQVGMRALGITNTVSEAELRAAGADVVSASLADWTVAAVHHVFD